MSKWYVYIARCADSSLYTGVTTELKRREREHNGELQGGAKYTRVRRPVEIVWSEPHENRSDATKREYQIKRYSRKKKLALVTEES